MPTGGCPTRAIERGGTLAVVTECGWQAGSALPSTPGSGRAEGKEPTAPILLSPPPALHHMPSINNTCAPPCITDTTASVCTSTATMPCTFSFLVVALLAAGVAPHSVEGAEFCYTRAFRPPPPPPTDIDSHHYLVNCLHASIHQQLDSGGATLAPSHDCSVCAAIDHSACVSCPLYPSCRPEPCLERGGRGCHRDGGHWQVLLQNQSIRKQGPVFLPAQNQAHKLPLWDVWQRPNRLPAWCVATDQAVSAASRQPIKGTCIVVLWG